MPYQKCKAAAAYLLTHGGSPDTFAKKRPRTAYMACFEGVLECALN